MNELITLLDNIAKNNQTDKSSNGHFYTRFYPKHLGHLIDKKFNLLEIGIDQGQSLNTWYQFFPKANITGIDIRKIKELDNDRIKTYLGSAADTAFLTEVNKERGPFDVIIDDGSHFNQDMLISFKKLFPLLEPGGVYVIEDLHCCYWANTSFNIFPQPTSTFKFTDYLKNIIDFVNYNGKYYTAYRNNEYLHPEWEQDLKKALGEPTKEDVMFESIHFYAGICFIVKNK